MKVLPNYFGGGAHYYEAYLRPNATDGAEHVRILKYTKDSPKGYPFTSKTRMVLS